MTSSHIGGDARQRLAALQEVLGSFGAGVRRDDMARLPEGVVEALCEYEANRIRALVEGTAAGWTPGWRHVSRPEQRDQQVDHSVAVIETVTGLRIKTHGPAEAPIPEATRSVPIQARPHRPQWGASA
jgi:hypothetical protein